MSEEESFHKPGIYEIAVWSDAMSPNRLLLTALHDGTVTVAKPDPEKAQDQRWSVQPGTNGTVAIQTTVYGFPSRSLSYKKPELGGRIILGPMTDFPTRQWRIDPAPQKPLPAPFFIRVPLEKLIIVVSPIDIAPPELALGASSLSLENAWTLIPLNDD